MCRSSCLLDHVGPRDEKSGYSGLLTKLIDLLKQLVHPTPCFFCFFKDLFYVKRALVFPVPRTLFLKWDQSSPIQPDSPASSPRGFCVLHLDISAPTGLTAASSFTQTILNTLYVHRHTCQVRVGGVQKTIHGESVFFPPCESEESNSN